MGTNKTNNLSSDASPAEIQDWLEEHVDEDAIELPKQGMSAAERGKVRRNIEAIKERNSLKAFLGEDYDLDFLDS